MAADPLAMQRPASSPGGGTLAVIRGRDPRVKLAADAHEDKGRAQGTG
jgi:hypothetical protein